MCCGVACLLPKLTFRQWMVCFVCVCYGASVAELAVSGAFLFVLCVCLVCCVYLLLLLVVRYICFLKNQNISVFVM